MATHEAAEAASAGRSANSLTHLMVNKLKERNQGVLEDRLAKTPRHEIVDFLENSVSRESEYLTGALTRREKVSSSDLSHPS